MGEAKLKVKWTTEAMAQAIGVETSGGRIQVRWDANAATTPFGHYDAAPGSASNPLEWNVCSSGRMAGLEPKAKSFPRDSFNRMDVGNI